jgi:hypothetical protein
MTTATTPDSEEFPALDLLANQLGDALLTTIDPTPPVDSHSAHRTALARAASPGYRRWLDHVSTVRGCERPIRLAGHLHTINPKRWRGPYPPRASRRQR